MDRSRSTCFTPGGTLLTQRSSFNNMFNTGIVSLAGKKNIYFRQTFYLQYPKSIIGIMNTTFMIFELCGSKKI